MSKRMMSEGGFSIRKWVTNSPELSRRIGIAETILDGPSMDSEPKSQVAEEEASYAKTTIDPFPNLVTQGYLVSVGIIKP